MGTLPFYRKPPCFLQRPMSSAIEFCASNDAAAPLAPAGDAASADSVKDTTGPSGAPQPTSAPAAAASATAGAEQSPALSHRKARSLARYREFQRRKMEARQAAEPPAPAAAPKEGAGPSVVITEEPVPDKGADSNCRLDATGEGPSGTAKPQLKRANARAVPPTPAEAPSKEGGGQAKWPKSFATIARTQPAVVIQGNGRDLPATLLDRVWQKVDSHLVRQILEGNVIHVAKTHVESCALHIQPADAESGTKLLKLLLELDWDADFGSLTIIREDERPRTHRHRVWVPAKSAVRTTEELRRLMLALNPGLPANGIVAHETVAKQGSEGFTAILGLSDSWMLRCPDLSTFSVGLLQLQIFSFGADATRPPPPEKSKRKPKPAKPAEVKRSGRTERHDHAANPDPSGGKAGRAAATGRHGKGRKAARVTHRAGLLQSAQRLLDSAKEKSRNPRPPTADSARAEAATPSEQAGTPAYSEALGELRLGESAGGSSGQATAPDVREEPMDVTTGAELSAEEEAELLSAAH